ncbi:hypothetical protein KOW79_013116 [Hemibagrus wyckioides]|uniref:Protein-glutamine gamma-glutamyltransferase K n=1 Tax=Hemibagrus wyckioides TaxID=337641 RepID=A0A9D3NKC6_9TELE|nr:hypothetical protein KOW79_013116 [Hemibagrus wyckioides]
MQRNEYELMQNRVFEDPNDLSVWFYYHWLLGRGLMPMLSRGTLVTVPLVDKLENKRWQAKIIEQKDSRIKLSISSPPTAPIGRYKLSVITWNLKGSTRFSPKPENDIYLLFNPWCKDDTVFIDKENERNEYVLNDVGKIYYGNDSQIGVRNWNFGQFADGILAACLFILEKSQALTSGLGDPVNVVRVVSAMVNSNDDQGVVVGNWSSSYANGTSPMLWTGSVEILTQYHKTKGKPVKYGQCWVFAGITNTVLRCLGIPTRCITNFNSAHDTDVSLTTDVYFDEKRRPIESLNNDSIWNFHVWNESWMARPDLPAGMGGWQVVDATPQETSQRTFCCGPTPVSAICDGLVIHTLDWTVPYDLYKDQLVDQAALMLTVLGHVIETKQVLATRFNFRLLTPKLTITTVGDAVVGKEIVAKITFKNPLPRVLKSVKICIEGLGWLKAKNIVYGDVASLVTITHTVKFTPTLSCQRKLLASLDCQQLTQVHGAADIVVKEK